MRIAFYLLAALVVLVVTVLVIAPAQWAAGAVRSATQGRVDLAEARGTVWNGSAVLVLAAASDATASRASLPERLSWQLSPWSLLAGQVDLTISHPSALTQPLVIRSGLFGGTYHARGDDRQAARLVTCRPRCSLEHGTSRRDPGAVLGPAPDRTAPADRQFLSRVAARVECADARLTDGPLSPADQRRLARNSAGITNHFRSPRAEGQWHNPRGWALTLFRPRTGLGGHRSGGESTTDRPHLAAGTARRRWGCSELRRWVT